MDCVRAAQTYVHKVCTATTGLKVLLLDSDSTAVVSLAATQSTLLAHSVYLVDRLDNPARALSAASASSSSSYPPSSSGTVSARGTSQHAPHLRCLVLVRASDAGVALAAREVREARFGAYWLFFTGSLERRHIEMLADADEHELVRAVEEVYADYAPVTPAHFSLNVHPAPLHALSAHGARPMALYGSSPDSFSRSSPALSRHAEGLAALLLALKRRPAAIRHAAKSSMAKQLATELERRIAAEPALWDFRPSASTPVVLVLDRRHDPVTPLLSQWTYQAMVHELLGINNARVDLSNAPDAKEDTKHAVLAPDQDAFFKAHLYDNFGDLGAAVSSYVREYGASSGAGTSGGKLDSIADMQRFVDMYPHTRALGANVAKHVALVGELARLVTKDHLFDVSELEQALASSTTGVGAAAHGADRRALGAIIANAEIQPQNKLRLAILYALRYERFQGNDIRGVIADLKSHDVPGHEAVNLMLGFAGSSQRQEELFAPTNLLARGRSALKGLKGVENVYTQHTPPLTRILEQLVRNRLAPQAYPYEAAIPAPLNVHPDERMPPPMDIVVFMVGGTTYEESKAVSQLNDAIARGHVQGANSGSRIVLGGTCIHNSSSFLEMVQDAAVGIPSLASSAQALLAQPPAATTAPTPTDSVALNIGPLSLNVNGPAGEAVDEARRGLTALFGRVRQGVGEISL